MLSHSGIWAAIDALAHQHGLSPSGLAKRAGLDSTAFNKSKRFSSDGRPRWPSTESLAKIMSATGSTFDDLFSHLHQDRARARTHSETSNTVPLIGFAQAGSGGYFDDAGFPTGDGWDMVQVPGRVSDLAYALQVQGDSMLPLYQNGGVLIVDPEVTVRLGDRVVAKTSEGEVMAKILQKRTASQIELQSVNPEHPLLSFAPDNISWMARVVWASQ